MVSSLFVRIEKEDILSYESNSLGFKENFISESSIELSRC